MLDYVFGYVLPQVGVQSPEKDQEAKTLRSHIAIVDDLPNMVDVQFANG